MFDLLDLICWLCCWGFHEVCILVCNFGVFYYLADSTLVSSLVWCQGNAGLIKLSWKVTVVLNNTGLNVWVHLHVGFFTKHLPNTTRSKIGWVCECGTLDIKGQWYSYRWILSCAVESVPPPTGISSGVRAVFPPLLGRDCATYWSLSEELLLVSWNVFLVFLILSISILSCVFCLLWIYLLFF